jgi:hypothetical protein
MTTLLLIVGAGAQLSSVALVLLLAAFAAGLMVLMNERSLTESVESPALDGMGRLSILHQSSFAELLDLVSRS